MKKINLKKKIGQITIKKIGEKFAVCISGTPQELKNSWELANKIANKLREKYGRRSYNNNNHNKKHCKKSMKKKKKK